MIRPVFILFLSIAICLSQPWWTRPGVGPTLGWPVEIIITNATTKSFPMSCLAPVSLNIDWGDGTSSTISAGGAFSHTYPATSTNIMRIKGTAARLRFGDATLAGGWPLKRVLGDLNTITNMTSLLSMFSVCQDLRSVPDGVFTNALLNGVATLSGTFNNTQAMTNYPTLSTLTNVNNLSTIWARSTLVSGFPDISALTKVTTLANSWQLCRFTTNFPDVSTLTLVNSLNSTWLDCDSAPSFPDVSTLTNVTDLTSTWNGNTNCTSLPDVTSLYKVTTCQSTWNQTRAQVYPSLSGLTNITTINSAWASCTSMTNIPTISDSTNLVAVAAAFSGNYNLVCLATQFWDTNKFPNMGTTAALIDNCYLGCTNIADYTNIPVAFR